MAPAIASREEDNGSQKLVHRKEQQQKVVIKSKWTIGKIASVLTLAGALLLNVILATVAWTRVAETGETNAGHIQEHSEMLGAFTIYLGAPAVGATLKDDYMQREVLEPRLDRILRILDPEGVHP